MESAPPAPCVVRDTTTDQSRARTPDRRPQSYASTRFQAFCFSGEMLENSCRAAGAAGCGSEKGYTFFGFLIDPKSSRKNP